MREKADLLWWTHHKEQVTAVARSHAPVLLRDLRLRDGELARLEESLARRPSVVLLAQVDQDGRFLSHYGPISGAAMVSPCEFRGKTRFELRLVVLANGHVAMEKHYQGNTTCFLAELAAMHLLAAAGCNVPHIFEVDFTMLVISRSYVRGTSLQEMLAKHGAIVRTRDMERSSAMMALSCPSARLEAYLREGRQVLRSSTAPDLRERIYRQLRLAHQAGVELRDLHYGNIVCEDESGEPFLVDLDSASVYPNPEGLLFTAMRDRDTEKLNAMLEMRKPTYSRLRRKGARGGLLGASPLYAPAYVGYGLRVGCLWDVNVGYGRWHFILKDILGGLGGKRILSLGANNAVNELAMLRAGAAEAVCLELDETAISQGHDLIEACEWVDNRTYRIRYVKANMAELPTLALGTFDLVVALCSLYYLTDADMSRVVEYIVSVTDTLVVQCNIRDGIGRPDVESYARASVEHITQLLAHAGFASVEVVAPRDYSRPVVVGRRVRPE